MEFGIEIWAILINEKRETTNDGRNRITKSRKNQNSSRKGNVLKLWNIGIIYHQIGGDKRKKLKRIFQEKEKASLNQTI